MVDDVSDFCSPIKDLPDLMNWKCDRKCWIHKHSVVDVIKISDQVICGNFLDYRDKDLVLPEYKLASKLLPKTIFCHDYKGGYLEDRNCKGCPNINTYRFFNWAGIDIFIYFSHHLVTIPPHGWINAGHLHGVPVLGTLITEWNDGEEIWQHILSEFENINCFSKKLAEICTHFQFDGFLLNIENKIPEKLVPRLIEFVRLLKIHLDLLCGKRTWLIWYDSVTTEGKLSWQNKLCSLNKPFFDACDGIFLNYVWNPAGLVESLEEAGTRRHDVFVGIDVWGRNCYQDGGFAVDKALAIVRSLNMSVALFAPAWTEELSKSHQEFLERELSFWNKLRPLLYIHRPTSLPLHTNFCQGILFDKRNMLTLFNLGKQQYQPTAVVCCAEMASLNHTGNVTDEGTCLKVSAATEGHSSIFHRIFACDFSGSASEKSSLSVTLTLKTEQSESVSRFRIYFVLEDKLSVEGKQSMCMQSQPKGYRTTVRYGPLVVSGTVIDFTAGKELTTNKIKTDTCWEVMSGWYCVKFIIELNAETSMTEILLLPSPLGSVLWGDLHIDRVSS